MRSVIWFTLAIAGAASMAGPADAATVRLKSRTFSPEPEVTALDEAVSEGRGRHFLAQFVTPVTTADRSALASLGISLVQYIPDDTWIVHLSPAAMTDADVRARLRWVGEIDVRDKVPVRWETDGIDARAIAPDGRVEIWARLHADADVDAAEAALVALGAVDVTRRHILPGFTFRIGAGLIDAVAALDAVSSLRERGQVVIDNDSNRSNIGVDVVASAPYDLTGVGVNFGIWDNGRVDAHQDFGSRLTVVEAAGVGTHATHVAGTVGGDGSRSALEGGSPDQWRGMAPGVDIFCWYFDDYIPDEMDQGSTEWELDVENNSWNFAADGGSCGIHGDYDFWAPELDALVRGVSGRTFSIYHSAGNERDDGDCPLVDGGYECINPPATAKNLVTCGATNSNNDTITGFSSWGPTDDGRIKPDIASPGCQSNGDGGVTSTFPGNDYGTYCGTSMAAPTTTGAGALLRQLYAAQNGGARPVPSHAKAIMLGTAVDLGNEGPDYIFGHGRLDVHAAADAMIDDTQEDISISDGSTVDRTFRVPAGLSSLRFVAAWDDPAGSTLADPALVNDIDIVLDGPGGTVVRPWVLDPSDPSAPATRGEDHLNNVEHITVDAPAAGSWTLQISGTNVPDGPQTVSLAGLDLNRPALPGSFESGETTDTSIDLTWTRASDADRKGTFIVRAAGPLFWAGPAQGTTYTVGQIVGPGVTVAFVGDTDHSSTPYTDAGLATGVTYNYAAYTFDDWHNYSAPAYTSGTTGTAVGVETLDTTPAVFALGAPAPNPARAGARTEFSIAEPGRTRVRVYDASGRLVRVLVDAALPAGRFAVSWDGRNVAGAPVAPGLYFLSLASGADRATARLVWTR